MDFQRAVMYCRWNTGVHMLDSGGETGRVWQRPPPKEKPGVLDGETIVLARFLRDHFHEDEAMTAEFMAFVDEPGQRDASFFDNEVAFMLARGYVSDNRDNTYNHPNSFDQEWIWQVWHHLGRKSSPSVAVNATTMVTISAHTGADVRGGYSPPFFGHFTHDVWESDNIPCLTVNWRLSPVTRSARGAEIADGLNERGSFRRSRDPRYELRRLAENVTECKNGSLRVTISGYTFYARPEYDPCA